MGAKDKDGEPRRGERLTINDIARLAHVSKRVINRSPLTKRESREKVLAVIDKDGYVPDPQARGLVLRRSFPIGLIYDNPKAHSLADRRQGILIAPRSNPHYLTPALVIRPSSATPPPERSEKR